MDDHSKSATIGRLRLLLEKHELELGRKSAEVVRLTLQMEQLAEQNAKLAKRVALLESPSQHFPNPED